MEDLAARIAAELEAFTKAMCRSSSHPPAVYDADLRSDQGSHYPAATSSTHDALSSKDVERGMLNASDDVVHNLRIIDIEIGRNLIRRVEEAGPIRDEEYLSDGKKNERW
ncbi:hypothetical protein VF21_07521 [Pseudogymnoascus sp. 05NY08]|nr:hypothetical protein VF21_07521 [Pseudogymnoascus sp. 05NY08]